MDKFSVAITGVGKSIGEIPVENSVLERKIGIDPGYIESKTGIVKRFYVSGRRELSDYSADAVQEALRKAKLNFNQVGCLICVTFSGEYVYPSLALKIVEKFQSAGSVLAFDLKANCTGFQSALAVADGLFQSHIELEHLVVVGNGIQSKFLDPSSIASIYFGDAASAIVLSREDCEEGLAGKFLAHHAETDTSAYDSVRLAGVDGSGVIRSNQSYNSVFYEISGLEVWKQAVRLLPIAVNKCVAKAGINVGHVSFFVWHQANLNLIEYLMGKLRAPMDKTITNVEHYGNTADASIGLALYDLIETGTVHPGDILCIAGIGAGFMAGCSIYRVGSKGLAIE